MTHGFHFYTHTWPRAIDPEYNDHLLFYQYSAVPKTGRKYVICQAITGHRSDTSQVCFLGAKYLSTSLPVSQGLVVDAGGSREGLGPVPGCGQVLGGRAAGSSREHSSGNKLGCFPPWLSVEVIQDDLQFLD